MSTLLINGLTAYGARQSPAAGLLHLRRLQSWYSGAQSKSDLREIPEGNGAWEITRDFRASLPITASGWSQCSDTVQLVDLMETMRAALQPNTSVEMQVIDARGIGTRKVSVRKLDLFEDLGAGWLEWAFDATAFDTTLYRKVIEASCGLATIGGGLEFPLEFPVVFGMVGDPGQLQTVNTGRAQAFTDFEVAGGVMQGGFEIVNLTNGRRLTYARSVLAGQTVHVDSKAQLVYVGTPGNNQSGSLRFRQWWSLPPGATHTIAFRALGVTSGTPTLTARTRIGS